MKSYSERVVRWTLLTVVCLISGCNVAKVNDLRLAGIEVVHPAQQVIPAELEGWNPDGRLVKLIFVTKTNIRDVAKEFGLHVGVDAYFCGNRKHELAGLGLLFDDNGAIGDNPRGSSRSDGNQVWFYVAERSGPAKDETGRPSIPSYDLVKQFKNVCVRLRGRNMALEGFSSNVVNIASDEVSRALAQGR